MMDRKAFFDHIRKPLFGGSMTEQQVERIEAIIDAATAARWSLPWLAYGLATAYHETARFVHLVELGGEAYFRKMYDPYGDRPALARKNGNTEAGDGARYRGRGFVHITWKNNYRKAGDKIGVDLVGKPDRAAEPPIAGPIMIAGMAEGWFTGKAMADYLNRKPPDYVNARRIINGVDKADMIAGYARTYEAALKAGAYSPGTTKPPAPPEPEPTPPPVEPVPPPPPTPPQQPCCTCELVRSIFRFVACMFGRK
jgi:hypothetical protein